MCYKALVHIRLFEGVMSLKVLKENSNLERVPLFKVFLWKNFFCLFKATNPFLGAINRKKAKRKEGFVGRNFIFPPV